MAGEIFLAILVFALWFGMACIRASIASNKGRSFWLWWWLSLLGVFPMFIIARLISDAPRREALGTADYAIWSAMHEQPTHKRPLFPEGTTFSWDKPESRTAPAGWYPDPNGTTSQRYWNGTAWTDHTL
jgi:hypothetical protein